MAHHHESTLFWRRYRPSKRQNSPSNHDRDHDQEAQKNVSATHSSSDQNASQTRVSIKERITHFTWANFTFPMSTGGIALLLFSNPHRFPGLTTIGKVVYIFDLVVFSLLTLTIITRFILRPSALRLSLLHPTESLFFPTFWLALVIIFVGAEDYAGKETGIWLSTATRVLFWLYSACTFLLAVVQFYILFTGRPTRLTIQSMTPGWILPVFPVMLTGTFASAIGPYQSTDNVEPILLAGLTFQGLGWMVSFMVFAIYMHRLIQFGLPAPDLRPGMFIAVGPPSFTAIALIGISAALPPESKYFSKRPGMIMTLQSLSDFLAVFLWCLAFWFFCISLLAVLSGIRKMSFHLIWYALIFPNSGFTIATINIGKRLESEGILWTGSVMTCLLVAVWLFVMGKHAEAVLRKRIMMPGVDEDREEYKDEDKRNGIPVPPSKPGSRFPSPHRQGMGRGEES